MIAAIAFAATQIGRSIGLRQIAPTLMRALGYGPDGDEPWLDPYPMSPRAVFHEAEYRTATDDGVGMNPVQRSASHFVDPFGKVAGRQPDLAIAGIRFQPLAQMSGPLRPEGDLGHIKRHEVYVDAVALSHKPTEHRQPKENQETHRIGNHRDKNGTGNCRILIEPVENNRYCNA